MLFDITEKDLRRGLKQIGKNIKNHEHMRHYTNPEAQCVTISLIRKKLIICCVAIVIFAIVSLYVGVSTKKKIKCQAYMHIMAVFLMSLFFFLFDQRYENNDILKLMRLFSPKFHIFYPYMVCTLSLVMFAFVYRILRAKELQSEAEEQAT